MIHPHTELRFINETIGFGVFATKFIPKGTITWVLDDLDQILEEEYVLTLDNPRKDLVLKYSYRNQQGQYVLSWDIGRYMNHSFFYNCVGTAYDLELAARDIHPGEELTDDYGTCNLDEPFQCLPENGSPRKIVLPDDLLYIYEEQDAKAFEALKQFKQVEQPLLHLVNQQYLRKIYKIIDNNEILDSIKSIFYDRDKNRVSKFYLRETLFRSSTSSSLIFMIILPSILLPLPL